MKVLTYRLLIGLMILTLTESCSMLTVSRCNWRFITSVGGIKIDDPFMTNDGWYLPIKCDISGTTKIANNPTALNSALECSKIKCSKNDSAIYVTVYKGLIGAKSNDCRCRSVNIGKLKDSKYKVYYKFDNETHLIGGFDVSKLKERY
jgi:hypothetical protein